MRLALVVDDSMLIRHTVARFLENHGFHVETATNGVEALQKLEELTPDLICTDLDMPKLTGTELIARLRLDSRFARTPIVVLTATRQTLEEDARSVSVLKDFHVESNLERALLAVTPLFPAPLEMTSC